MYIEGRGDIQRKKDRERKIKRGGRARERERWNHTKGITLDTHILETEKIVKKSKKRKGGGRERH